MTPSLRDKIARARAALTADPMGVVAGEVRAPAVVVPSHVRDRWALFADLLAEADGGRFGSIDVWSLAEYEAKQYPSVDFPGGRERWLIIGQLLYEPMALDSKTGQLYLFARDGDEDGENLGEFDEFFTDAVFGSRYAQVIADGDKDEWWGVLGAAGLR